ncbi:MAG: DUF4430 domain-containing protein, partial [Ruthenibacterium sp.]
MKKRALAAFLSIVMLFTFLPVTALAETAASASTVEAVAEESVPTSESASVSTSASASTSVPEETVIAPADSAASSTAASSAPLQQAETAAPEAVETLPQQPKEAEAAPEKAAIGKVHVIVENTTFTAADGAPWEGILLEEWVDINQDSSMMSAFMDAIAAAGQTQSGAENGYIQEVGGLAAFDGGSMSGWMGTLNDWFTDAGFDAFNVADGSFGVGDEVRIQYTCNMGADIGANWGDSDQTLKSLTFSDGTLAPAFAGDVREYTLTVPAATHEIIVTPAAVNKY